jgi:hypothetical protein
MSSHQRIDERSLAFGRAIVARMMEDPSIVPHARATLARWMMTCSDDVRPALLEWRSVLDGSADEIAAILTGDNELAKRLRQSNPFAGVLSQSERNAILREYRSNDPQTA